MEEIWKYAGYILLFIVGTIANDARTERKRKRARQRQAGNLEPAVERDTRIIATLAQLLFALRADKAKIFRFHNGGIYYNGQSIKKFTMTHLQLRPGVAGPKPGNLKELASSLFPNMLKQIIDKKDSVTCWRSQEAPDGYLKSLHMDEGVHYVMVVGLRDGAGEMLGFMSVNWIDERQTEPSDQDKKTMLGFADQVGYILSNNK